MESMNNGIFISFSYNDREIDGIDDFKNELSLSYNCHGVARWIPSCSEGGEFWLTVFLSVSFWDFVKDFCKDIVKDGLVYAGKKFFLAPLKQALTNLRKTNKDKWPLKILCTSFQFEDIEVVIGDIRDDEIASISTLFRYIKSISGLLCPDDIPVKKIEMPAIFIPGDKSFALDSYRLESSNLQECIWIITNRLNEKRLFDAKQESFIDFEELKKRYTLL